MLLWPLLLLTGYSFLLCGLGVAPWAGGEVCETILWGCGKLYLVAMLGGLLMILLALWLGGIRELPAAVPEVERAWPFGWEQSETFGRT
jgi:hypothetical protein